MELIPFHTLRAALQGNASPGTARQLGPVQQTLTTLLEEAGFDGVEVERTDDPDRLVIGLCQFRQGWSEQEVAGWLERTWAAQIGYPFWEAHALVVDAQHVELEAASRVSGTGHYLTVHLIAERALIPSQRAPMDGPGRPAAESLGSGRGNARAGIMSRRLRVRPRHRAPSAP